MYSQRESNWYKRDGFTLIEIIVVSAIFVVLAAGLLVNFNSSRTQVALDTGAEEVVTVLATARSRTVASQNEELWGVHFASDSFTLFKGPLYASDPSSYEERKTARGTSIALVSFSGGGQDVLFDRLTGTTATVGSLRLEALNNPSQMRTIYIESSGRASLVPSPAPPQRLLDDTRHVHFTLPWSLANSTLMHLLWTDPPSPSVQVDIVISDFITSGQFLWESDTNVNGSLQHLRIVSHSITANQTVLAIRRDRDENSKALTVSVDMADVASYTASGDVTSGSGITYDIQ